MAVEEVGQGIRVFPDCAVDRGIHEALRKTDRPASSSDLRHHSLPRMYCYHCGAPAQLGDGVHVCGQHGPLWALIRNAPCADVIVERDGKALLTRRAMEPYAGRWELPGGFQNKGEHPADAARRELKEELGLDVSLTGLLGIYLDPYEESVVQVTVYTGIADGEPRPDSAEVLEWRWFAADELPPQAEMAVGHFRRLADWRLRSSGGTPRGLGLDLSS